MPHTSFPLADLRRDLRAYTDLSANFTIRVISDGVLLEYRTSQWLTIFVDEDYFHVHMLDELGQVENCEMFPSEQIAAVDLPELDLEPRSWVRGAAGSLERLRCVT